MNKAIGVIVVVVIVIILFPTVLNSLNDARTDPQTDAFPASVVAGGATDVVLTADPLNNAVAHVTAITASGAGATPVASTYTTATNTLHITGLGADTPQDITVTYNVDATTDFTGLGEFMSLTPLLLWLGIIGAILGGIFVFVKTRG